jgi:hypothetical protein
MRVAFLPPSNEFEGNGLFEGRRTGVGAHSPNTHWFDCYVALGEVAKEAGIVMQTADRLPPNQADVVVFMAQPSPGQMRDFRAQHPGVKTALILLETSLGAAFSFNRDNHRDFDIVLTYKSHLIDHKKYFPLRPHSYFLDRRRKGRPFSERRTACLVATHRNMQYRTGLMLGRSGWRLTWSERLDYTFCPGELVTYRSRIGRACMRDASGEFDVIGEGWDGDAKARSRALPPPSVSTLDYVGNYRFYLAFENHGGPESLISERIWDALWAGSVPVYMGNPEIAKVVPPTCFVDARGFKTPNALLSYLLAISQSEWESHLAAADDFLSGDGVKPFLPQACARELLEPFLVLKGHAA